MAICKFFVTVYAHPRKFYLCKFGITLKMYNRKNEKAVVLHLSRSNWKKRETLKFSVLCWRCYSHPTRNNAPSRCVWWAKSDSHHKQLAVAFPMSGSFKITHQYYPIWGHSFVSCDRTYKVVKHGVRKYDHIYSPSNENLLYAVQKSRALAMNPLFAVGIELKRSGT